MQILIPIEEAEKRIFSQIKTAEQETIDLKKAYGRTLREPITADREIPPYDRAMMDGIALNSEEYHGIGTDFIYAGTQAAGTPPLEKLLPQTCFEVMTGAVLPKGCDCVVPVEELSREGDSYILSPNAEVRAGHFIHARGTDAEKGNILIPSGKKLGHAELAVAASVGAVELKVARLPIIHLLTTGDEVISPEKIPKHYEIRRSHPSALQAFIEEKKLGLCKHTHLADDAKHIQQALENSLENADFIVLTGGISKGKFDHVAPAMRQLIGEPLFHGIKQKPGKPMAFWQHKNTSIFALPGNPLSVLATAHRYLFPALRTYQETKKERKEKKEEPALRELAEDINWQAPLPGFLPVIEKANGTLKPLTFKNSGDYTNLVGMSGFVELPTEKKHYPASTRLIYWN